ncbi:PAS-domain containing protein [Aquabacterium humicola]|uniref:PAS-domain containing protein n=1 Tax=Aquabacterium humicola TaxID=3237377 RepID=UPI002542B68B|nr:PAS-domain containing protein [Rubrivivax pictus]
MRPAVLPVRLLAEVSAIVAIAVAAVAWLLAPAGALSAIVGALLVVLLAAPAIYWRNMQTLRRAALPAGPPPAAAANLVSPERLERRRRRAIFATAAAHLSGVALTALAGWYVDGQMRADARQHFERLAERVALEVQRRFADPVHALKGVRASIALTGSTSPAQLRAYLRARDFERDFAGVQGVLFAESTDALAQAVDGGDAALLDGAALPGAAGAAADYAIVLPVYRGAALPATPGERRAALIGVVAAPVKVDALLQGVAKTLGDTVAFELHDGRPGAGAGRGGAERRDREAAERRQSGGAARPEPALRQARTLQIGGRPLILDVSTTPDFEAALDRGPLGAVVLGGAVLSFLLALVVWALSSARIRAQTFAERMTGDLDRLAQVVRHTDNSVVITDRAQRITWVNEAFTHITGYGADEALGRTPAQLLGNGQAEPAVLQALADAVAGGRACNVEVLNRTKDGRAFWLDLELRPLFDTEGALAGFMEIGRDVTERHRAAQQLESALRENSALLAMIDQHALVGICDGRGRLTHVNDAFCRVSGYTREELIGRSHRLLDGGVEPREFWEPVWEAAAAGRSWRGEARCLSKDGATYWVDTTIAPMLDAQGRPERFITIRSDITASKQAARELAIERERLQQGNRLLQVILDHLPCGLSVFDEHLNLIVATPQFRKLLDLPDEIFASQPVPLERMARFNAERGEYGPGDVDRIVAEILDRARAPTAYSVERQRGNLTLEVRGMPMPGGGLVATYTDITERKHFEAVLADSAHMMRLVTDNIPGRLAYFDREYGLTFANRATLAFFGGDASTHTGRSFDDLVGPERGDHGRRAERALAGEAQTYDVESRSADGEMHYAIVHLLPDLRDGRVQGFVAMATDVTHVKRAEREMQRAEALLRGAIDVVNEAFVLYDADDRLVFCNDKYRELYASSVDALVPGNTFEQILRTGAERGQYPDAVGRVDDWVRERLAVHQRSGVSLVQRLDSGRHVRVVERRMADGHIVGFRIDITDLVRANEAAEAASRAKSSFVANMSHEIRTPMNAVLGMLTLLRRSGLGVRQLDFADKAERAARALLRLLDDILDFSKVEAGKLELDPRPFSIDRLLRDLSVVVSANLGAKPVEVLFEVDAGLPEQLVGDDLRLQQVLVNLSGNAIKFTERGEVVISVRQRGRSASAVRLEIAVRDTGIGIAPAQQQHIFNAFAQAEATTTRRFGGTGLGLSICQRLVALMGGEIRLDSTPGRGSRFSFELELPVAAEAAPVAGQALHTLIVDDNPVAREVIAEQARALGWTVDVADSGAQALEQLDAMQRQGRAHDAIFVDWSMPGLDGWQTSRRIRERQQPGQAVPMLMMVTAHGRDKLAQRTRQEQTLLDGFLVKPVTASMLQDAVRDARTPGSGLPAPARPAEARLRGLRLLVVEDNLTNQQVAEDLLADEGAIVHLAADGEQGVAAVAAADPPYDAVLMDVQMPVMDGYAAAAAIRTTLGRTSLPIIAMTANAMPGDREASLVAGMNDHVGKPFDLDELVAVVLRHVGGAAAAPAQAARTRLPDALLQRAQALGVDLQQAVDRLSGKRAVWRRSARSFAAELPGHRLQLAALLQRGERSEAARLLHTIKGVAATLGADALAACAADGEVRLGEARLGDVRLGEAAPDGMSARLAESIDTEIARAQAGLQAVADLLDDGQAGPPAAAPDPAALAAGLQALMPLLAEGDMVATDVFADLQAAHEATWGEAMQPLADAMARLDFPAALSDCERLRAQLAPASSGPAVAAVH